MVFRLFSYLQQIDRELTALEEFFSKTVLYAKREDPKATWKQDQKMIVHRLVKGFSDSLWLTTKMKDLIFPEEGEVQSGDTEFDSGDEELKGLLPARERSRKTSEHCFFADGSGLARKVVLANCEKWIQVTPDVRMRKPAEKEGIIEVMCHQLQQLQRMGARMQLSDIYDIDVGRVMQMAKQAARMGGQPQQKGIKKHRRNIGRDKNMIKSHAV